MLVALLLLSCSVADHPACVDTELHTCSDIEVLQSCNNLLALDGLTVNFVGAELAEYTATVNFDGAATTFSCPGSDAAPGHIVWGCGPTQFQLSGWGDSVEVTVESGGTSWTDTYEPCWTATEPNGTCCGWNFTAEVDLAVD